MIRKVFESNIVTGGLLRWIWGVVFDVFWRMFVNTFYIFTFEPSFGIIEKDKDSLEDFKKQYNDIVKRLAEACKDRKITEYQESTIIELSGIVLDAA